MGRFSFLSPPFQGGGSGGASFVPSFGFVSRKGTESVDPFDPIPVPDGFSLIEWDFNNSLAVQNQDFEIILHDDAPTQIKFLRGGVYLAQFYGQGGETVGAGQWYLQYNKTGSDLWANGLKGVPNFSFEGDFTPIQFEEIFYPETDDLLEIGINNPTGDDVIVGNFTLFLYRLSSVYTDTDFIPLPEPT